MHFEISQNNAFTGLHWSYSKDDVDLFFLYCIENDSYVLVRLFNVLGLKSITIRPDDYITLNNQSRNIRILSDYTLEKTLSSLGYEVSLEK